jgi:hypothetical protein
MIEIQRAMFLRMAQDATLLNLLGLDSADESEISKRIVPTPPGTDIQDIETLIIFRFPPTALLSSPVMQRRPVQFRIWGSDSSTETQQNISGRLQELFVSEDFGIAMINQYSVFFYTYEAQIPGNMAGKFGWMLELEIHTSVHKN